MRDAWDEGRKDGKALRLEVGDCSYEIDFEHMVQRNVYSGRTRGITRDMYWEDTEHSITWTSETSLRRSRGMESVSSSRGLRCAPTSLVTDSRPSEEYPHTLKIVFMGAAHRMRVTWHPKMSPADVLGKIDAAVRDCIGRRLDEDAELALTYTDDDGDVCHLVQETLEDCLSFARNGVLKLLVEQTSVDYTNPIGVVASTQAISQDSISIASPRVSPHKPTVLHPFLAGAAMSYMDGHKTYEPVMSEAGQLLYTDGEQVFMMVYVPIEAQVEGYDKPVSDADEEVPDPKDYTNPSGFVASTQAISQDDISIASPSGSELSWELVEPLAATAAKEQSCDTVVEATIVV